MSSFTPVSAEEMIKQRGLHNYGCLFIADLWPKEIAERTGVQFKYECDDFDWNDSAYLVGEVDGIEIPVIVVRYRGYPERSTSIDIPLEYLANRTHIAEITGALREYLNIKQEEISWQTGDPLPYLVNSSN